MLVDRRRGHDRRQDAQRRRLRVQPGLAHVLRPARRSTRRIAAGHWIVVDDLVYDETGFIHFEPNDIVELGSTPGVIFGNAGEVQVKDTWDFVTITNASDRRLVTNLIDVVSSADDPLIEIAVDSIPGPVELARQRRLAAARARPADATFEFDIKHVFPRTAGEIENTGVERVGASDIVLDGDIENPIGRTYIKNPRGNILVRRARLARHRAQREPRRRRPTTPTTS